METLAHSPTAVPRSSRMDKEIRKDNVAVTATTVSSGDSRVESQQGLLHTHSKLLPQSHNHVASPAGFRSYAPVTAAATTTQPSSQDSSVESVASRTSFGDAMTTLTSAATSPNSLSSFPQQQRSQPREKMDRLDKLAMEWSPLKKNAGRGGDEGMPAPESRARVDTPETHKTFTDTTSPPGQASPSARNKRTASGMLKPAGSAVSPVLGSNPSPAREGGFREKRAESVSSSGSRAGEAAAQLKMRLAYAMAKVQHGWQNHNIDQVEALAASLPPRMTASSPTHAFISPRSVLSSSASRLSMYDSAPIAYADHYTAYSSPNKRRSGGGLISWANAANALPSPSTSFHRRSYSNNATAAPPVHNPPPSTRRNNSAVDRPALMRNNHSDGPHTPKAKRVAPPPMLRTNTTTAQAEQDAMDALMLMGGSPSHSQSQQSQQQQQHQQQSQSSQAMTADSKVPALELFQGNTPTRGSTVRHSDAAGGAGGRGRTSSTSSSLASSPLKSGSGVKSGRDALHRANSSVSTSSTNVAEENERELSTGGADRPNNDRRDSGERRTKEEREKLLDEVEAEGIA